MLPLSSNDRCCATVAINSLSEITRRHREYNGIIGIIMVNVGMIFFRQEVRWTLWYRKVVSVEEQISILLCMPYSMEDEMQLWGTKSRRLPSKRSWMGIKRISQSSRSDGMLLRTTFVSLCGSVLYLRAEEQYYWSKPSRRLGGIDSVLPPLYNCVDIFQLCVGWLLT